jgi:hypothetical protein
MILTAAFGCASIFMNQTQMLTALVIMFNPLFALTAWQTCLLYLTLVVPLVTCPELFSPLRVVLIPDFSVGMALCFPSKSLPRMSSFLHGLG